MTGAEQMSSHAGGCRCGADVPDAGMPSALKDALRPVNVVVGHYGVGKTNLALNLALDATREGQAVVLVDLDVVNPYFRSTEYRGLLEEAGVEVVAPVFAEAGSSLDVPSLTGAVVPAVQRAFAGECTCIIDAGGDDVGATALGRFARHIAAGPYAMFYVTNCYRNLTHTPQEACEILREVERASRLRATGIISNAHLMGDTDAAAIGRGVRFAHETATLATIPLVCATVPKTLFHQESENLSVLCDQVSLYPVELHVKTPWQA